MIVLSLGFFGNDWSLNARWHSISGAPTDILAAAQFDCFDESKPVERWKHLPDFAVLHDFSARTAARASRLCVPDLLFTEP
ncbi:MAG TPA: hypothetical protein VFW05_01635, partial [Verrucomicrobiae bacterium]|nr:hypothetical protein [Verrucomicrobiae bacterium]